jgi:polyhydroxyalkanoate synthesis regulator phasin
LPVLEEIIPVVREMVGEFGTKLLAAVKAVDFKTILTDLANFTGFLITNIETISKVVAAVYILNTAFKLMAVASGIATVAIKLQAWFTAQLTTGMTIATVATTVLSAAMRLIPFVAIAGGIALVVTGVMNLGNEAHKSTNLVVGLDGAIRTAGNSAERSVGQFEATANGIKRINEEIAKSPAISTSAAYDRAEANRFKNMAEASKAAAGAFRPTVPGMPDFSAILAGSGASQAAADAAQAAAEAQRVADEIARANEMAAQEAADALAEIERQAQAERERAAAAEQAILDKRENAYKSFADSVKQLFGQIKDNILSSFNLPQLGNSVNSITRNIGKLLEKTKGFANSISQLSGMGLNSALLQQVIQAGPLAGSRLASAIVGGGSAFISQLNSAYGEMGGLASGIAGVGTRSAFDNPTIANTYNIEVNGGVGSGPTIGKAIVEAIKSYERTSGAVWQGA